MERFAQGQPFFTHWKLHRLLHQGRECAVYELRRTELGVTYRSAMKVISARRQSHDGAEERYPPLARRAICERFLMARLKGCSYLVSYEDHDVLPHPDGGGWDFLLRMELLTPLWSGDSRPPVPAAQVVAMGIALCRGLEYCQQNGILHRDIKPSNLFFTELGGCKLGDFGLSCFAVDGRGARSGTPNYMAPEVYHGAEASYCADVYSLGLTLYVLLHNGCLPFSPGTELSPTALNRRLAGEALPRPAHGSDHLWAVVERACAFSPELRFASARGLRLALEQCRS